MASYHLQWCSTLALIQYAVKMYLMYIGHLVITCKSDLLNDWWAVGVQLKDVLNDYVIPKTCRSDMLSDCYSDDL